MATAAASRNSTYLVARAQRGSVRKTSEPLQIERARYEVISGSCKQRVAQTRTINVRHYAVSNFCDSMAAECSHSWIGWRSSAVPKKASLAKFCPMFCRNGSIEGNRRYPEPRKVNEIAS